MIQAQRERRFVIKCFVVPNSPLLALTRGYARLLRILDDGGKLLGSSATGSGGNGAAVRAGARVAQKRTDAIRGFRREDMLEPARLFGHLLLIVQAKRVHEE